MVSGGRGFTYNFRLFRGMWHIVHPRRRWGHVDFRVLRGVQYNRDGGRGVSDPV